MSARAHTCARLYSGQTNQRPAACPQIRNHIGKNSRGREGVCVPSSPRLIELPSGGLNMGAHGIQTHTHAHPPQATVSSCIQSS